VLCPVTNVQIAAFDSYIVAASVNALGWLCVGRDGVRFFLEAEGLWGCLIMPATRPGPGTVISLSSFIGEEPMAHSRPQRIEVLKGEPP